MKTFIKAFALCASFLMSDVMANGGSNMDIQVQASIQSSMHMQWKMLPLSDERYQQARKKLIVKKGWRVLPYGLYAELQTNDYNRLVSLRVGDFFTNSDDIIKKEHIYVSVNGELLHKAVKDVPLLLPDDRSELKKYTILFLIKTMPGHRAGQYQSNVQFITQNLS